MHRNPFPRPSPLERVLLDELVHVAGLCYQRGWTYGTAGNFSLRGSEGLIWQSPSGLNKGFLAPSGFVPVDLETGRPVNPQAAKASMEMPVHLGVYRAVNEARAIVHVHSPAFVKASRSGHPLVFRGEEMQKAFGFPDHLGNLVIRLIENPTPADMAETGKALESSIDPRIPLVALSSHGVYAWGKTPLEALVHAEALEFLCETTFK